MAKEEKLEVEDPGKKSRKTLFIIIGAVLGGIAAGVAVAFLLLGSGSENEQQTEPEVVVAESMYFKYEKPFLVNLKQGNTSRFFQVEISFRGKSQKAVDLLELHEPVVKNRLNQLLGSQDVALMQTDAGRQQLVLDITQTVNDFLREYDENASIETALFNSFVMQ